MLLVCTYKPSAEMRQDDHTFEVRWGYIARSCLKNKLGFVLQLKALAVLIWEEFIPSTHILAHSPIHLYLEFQGIVHPFLAFMGLAFRCCSAYPGKHMQTKIDREMIDPKIVN